MKRYTSIRNTPREQRDTQFDLRSQQRQERAKLSLQEFLHNIIRQDPVAFARRAGCIIYSVPWVVQPGPDGFRTFIKNSNGTPFIPGSELKGALRTAVLYTLLKDKYEFLKDELLKVQRALRSGRPPWAGVRELEEMAGNLESQLLRGKGQKNDKSDAKFDFFKLVQIHDAPLALDKIRIRAMESMGTRRFTRTLAETVDPGAEGSFSLTIAESGKFSWAIEKLGLPEQAQKQLSLEALFQAVYHHSDDILKEEGSYFSSDRTMQQRILVLEEQNKPGSPLLRLGAGQGFLSTTVDLLAKQRDPELYEQAIREGVSKQRRWRTTPGRFPKTRRVVSDGRGNPVDLCSWVKLVT